MRQALYRTYRPVKFSEVVGQSHIRTILSNQIAAGEIGHAYLFTGPKGTGKTSIARIVARAVNCPNMKDGEPCGKCDLCVAFDNNQMMDLIEIDAASNRGIDNVRELISKVSLAPSMGKYKVYVIDEAHQLTKEAANALLKTLEEPPAHAIFILATTEADKLIPTIVSRCQRFDFRYLTTNEIADWLEKVAREEKIGIDKEAIEFIAQQSAGGMRDALSWLDQARMLGEHITKEQIAQGFGFVDFAEVIAITKLVARGEALAAIEKLNEIYRQGFDLGRLSAAWSDVVRNLLTVKLGNESLVNMTTDQVAEMKELAGSFTVDQIVDFLEALMNASREVKSAIIPQLPLEIVIVKMASQFQIPNSKLKIDEEEVVQSREEKMDPRSSMGSGNVGDDKVKEMASSDRIMDAPTKVAAAAEEKVEIIDQIKVVPRQARETTIEESEISSDASAGKFQIPNSKFPGGLWPEDTEGLWKKFITAVRASSPTLAATVASALPEFNSNELVLKFAQSFYKQKVEEMKSTTIIQAALEQQGIVCSVRCTVDESKLKHSQPVDLAQVSSVFEIS